MQPALVWPGGNEGNEDVNQTPDLLPFDSFVHFCSDICAGCVELRRL
jgi:hypothetical protein